MSADVLSVCTQTRSRYVRRSPLGMHANPPSPSMIQRDLDEDGEFLYLVGSHCTPHQGDDSP
nr:hypothetical protein [uncultured Porphyromonas sp.]